MFRSYTSTVQEKLTIPHRPGQTLRRHIPCVAALLWDFDEIPALPLRILTPRLIVLRGARCSGLSRFNDVDAYDAVAIMLLTPFHTYIIPDRNPERAKKLIEGLEVSRLQDAAAKFAPTRALWGAFRPDMGHIWIAGNPPPIAPAAGAAEADAHEPCEAQRDGGPL